MTNIIANMNKQQLTTEFCQMTKMFLDNSLTIQAYSDYCQLLHGKLLALGVDMEKFVLYTKKITL